MDKRDTPQYLKDARQADLDTFSGNSRTAQDERLFANNSGSGKYDSQITPSRLDRKRNKKEKEKQQKVATYISIQIHNIQSDILRLNALIEKYQNHIRKTGQQIKINTANIHVFAGVKDVLEDTLDDYGPDATYADFLKSVYGDKVFTAASGNAWEALQNPLRDADGNAVYSDKNGHLYCLKTGEDDQPVIDETTGAPVRIYYEDPNVIADFMKRAFDAQNPEVFTEYSSKGMDPANYRMQEVMAFVRGAENVAPHPEKMITVHEPFISGDGADIEDYFQVCDANQCRLIEDIKTMEKDIEQTSIQLEETESKLKERQRELLEAYESRNKAGLLTPEEQKDYETLKQEMAGQNSLTSTFAPASWPSLSGTFEYRQDPHNVFKAIPPIPIDDLFMENIFDVTQPVLAAKAPVQEPDLHNSGLKGLENEFSG